MNHNLAYVSLTAAGFPVAVSTGVSLINRKGLGDGVGVRVRTDSYAGGADLAFEGPVLGPDAGRSWASNVYLPEHPASGDCIRQLHADSLDFTELSSVWPYWVADVHGAYALMDHASRKLVRVSPLDRSLCRGFWSGIVAALRREPAQEAAAPLFNEWCNAHLYNLGVWVCLGPAPYSDSQPVLWCFDGQHHVRFDWTGEREAERDVIAEEAMMGLPAYA